MKAEDTRNKLITELQAQFAKIDASLSTTLTPDDQSTTVAFPSPKFEKPRMFMPKVKNSNTLSLNSDDELPVVNGIGFGGNKISSSNCGTEIYNIQELIATNPEGMRTLSYDKKIVKAQMALIKKKEWQDILFEDVDWFKKIDLTLGIKKMFKNF